MTSKEIIEELYLSPFLNNLIKKFKPEKHQEDLRQELMIILLTKDESLIIDLHQKKQLTFFVTRIVLNMVKSDHSKFFRTFRREFSELDLNSIKEPVADEVSFADRLSIEDAELDMYNSINEELNSMHWYEKSLFEVWHYECNGVGAKVSRKTGIPARSVLDTINKVKSNIRNKCS